MDYEDNSTGFGFGGRSGSPQDAYNNAYAQLKARYDFSRKGRRIDARAPMAKVQSGLRSGGDKTTRMSNSAWVDTFTKTSPKTQDGALTERMRNAGDSFDPQNRQNYKGISADVVDSIMGNNFWNNTFGGGNPNQSRFAGPGPAKMPIIIDPNKKPFDVAKPPSLGQAQQPRYGSVFGWNMGT